MFSWIWPQASKVLGAGPSYVMLHWKSHFTCLSPPFFSSPFLCLNCKPSGAMLPPPPSTHTLNISTAPGTEVSCSWWGAAAVPRIQLLKCMQCSLLIISFVLTVFSLKPRALPPHCIKGWCPARSPDLKSIKLIEGHSIHFQGHWIRVYISKGAKVCISAMPAGTVTTA